MNLERMRKNWEALTKKQRLSILAGIAILSAIIIGEFVVFPLYDAKRKLNRSIALNEKVLEEMVKLGAEYQVLQTGTEEIRRTLAQRSPDFNLFSHLEKKAGAAGMRSSVKSLSPSRGAVSGPYEELIADIRLEKITLKQLSNFLYITESPAEFISIRKISISKMKESPEYLSATIQYITYQPLKSEQVPAQRKTP